MVSLCELCGADADLHCAADSAFLCRFGDAKFHASNFLFARHLRRIICSNCKSLTQDLVSGSLLPWPLITTCCSKASYNNGLDSFFRLLLLLVSGLCLKLQAIVDPPYCDQLARRRKERVKAVAVADSIFVNWCDKLGIDKNLQNDVVSYASLALAVEKRPRLRATTKVIFAAAAFWFGVKNTMKQPSLKKVEDITGVGTGMMLQEE